MKEIFEGLPFIEAIEFLRKKTDVPTEHWDDLWRGMHSRGFMVAGTMQLDLVNDFHEAINRAIEKGTTLADFRKDFDAIVERYGWSYHGTRRWRSALIYNTNLSQAYNAGRWKKQNDPAVLKAMPYLVYKHGDAIVPRPEHVSWDGTVLRADDPWWKTHYPKNGWGCHCYVVSASERDLERMGKAGPDTAPDNGTYRWTDRYGNVHEIPVGIDPGFDYNPGMEAYDHVPDLGQEKKYFQASGIKKEPESLQEALDLHEPELLKRATEKLMSFDASGKLLFEKAGTRSMVQFTDDEVKGFKGTFCTHNHPSGTSLSPEDVRLALFHELAEIRAVGSRYRYSLQPNPGHDLPKSWERFARIFQEQYIEADEHVRELVMKKISSGTINVDAANMIHFDMVWRRVAKKTGWFTYRRMKWQK